MYHNIKPQGSSTLQCKTHFNIYCQWKIYRFFLWPVLYISIKFILPSWSYRAILKRSKLKSKQANKGVRGKREVPGLIGGSLTSGPTPWTRNLWLHLLLAEAVELGSGFPDFTTFPNDKVHLWSLCSLEAQILRLGSILLNPDVKRSPGSKMWQDLQVIFIPSKFGNQWPHQPCSSESDCLWSY